MLYYIELINSLKRGVLAPVYLFCGEETYLLERALLRFAEYFSAAGEDELNCESLDGEALTPAEIIARAEAAPFFSDKRLLIVKNPSFIRENIREKPAGTKDKKAISGGADGDVAGEKATPNEKVLLNYFENPAPSTCLILVVRGVPDKRKRIFRSIKKNGRVVEFTYLSKGDLRQWLDRRAKAAGKTLELGAAEVLLNRAGPSLQNLAMEWEKLDNYTAGRDGIKRADVEQLVTPAAEENIFAIMDAMCNRRSWEALRGVKELLLAKEPPPRLLAMIARQFRLLLQITDLSARGAQEKEIIAKLKLHPFVYRKIAAQKNNFSQAALIEALQTLATLDADMKTGRQEFYPALETFLLKMSLDS